MRLEANATTVQFTVETLDVGLEERTFDLNGEIADAEVQQLFIRQTMPGKPITHASDSRKLGLGGAGPLYGGRGKKGKGRKGKGEKRKGEEEKGRKRSRKIERLPSFPFPLFPFYPYRLSFRASRPFPGTKTDRASPPDTGHKVDSAPGRSYGRAQ